MATVIEAAQALLDVCDGASSRDTQGYNGSDSPFVRDLFKRKFLTQAQLSSLHKLLAKYSGQLSGLGFVYDDLEIPQAGPRSSATGSTGIPSTNNGDQAQHGNLGEWSGNTAPQVPAPARPAWGHTVQETMALFPEGFDPRPQQTVAIEKITKAFESGKRVVVLEMPTGGGKSFICKTIADVVSAKGGKTHFLTIQKQLQEQYLRDFPAPQLEVLKGRANYGCTLGGENAADAPCTAEKKGILPECVKGCKVRHAVRLEVKPENHLCPYWKQLQKCAINPITLFNFSSFLFQQRIGRFGNRDLMIVDEAHNIESQLMGFVSLELTEWALGIINVQIDREITTKEQLLEWLREKDVAKKVDEALGDSDELSEDCDTDLRKSEVDALRELQSKIETFMGYMDRSEWVYDTVTYRGRGGRMTKKIQARPLFAKEFANDLLFNRAEHVLVMSATILNVEVWAENLGLSMDEVALVQTPCEFPVENRTVHLEYAGNMGRKYFSDRYGAKNPTKPKFIQKIKQILKRHEGQRGIIHCHSFELSDVLRHEVASPRFLFQSDFGGDKQLMLSALESQEDAVIVAPAMHEGFDFKGDLARFQVIAKVPWPSLGDKVIKERANRDGKWYGWQTALKLVQSYGRIVRSSSDWGYTYIVDQGFEGFAGRNRSMLPGWFIEATRKYGPREVRR